MRRTWMAGGLSVGLLLSGAVGIACSASDGEGESAEAEVNGNREGLRKTLDDLAAFGEKRVGTPEGKRAAEYVMQRMSAAGLQQIRFETFNFPQHIADLKASSFSVTEGGKPMAKMEFDIFEGSGNGRAENAEIVFVGSAKPRDLEGKDLKGKIAFVARDTSFHRSSQYRNVAAAGAVAMLYQSAVPTNQIQIGSIREKWEAMGPIPTVTIGQDDGDRLRCLLGARSSKPDNTSHDRDNRGPQSDPDCHKGGELRATIEVKARNAHGTGQNVVGVIPGKHFGQRDASGKSLDKQIVVGAHYDTWYVGSVDNGCGVAGLLELAETRAAQARQAAPEHTLVFVAFDGEEVGLYGGYDYLRKHQDEGILSVINLESPAAEKDLIAGGFESLVRGVASSEIPAIEDAMSAGDLTGLFTAFLVEVSLDRIAKMFGGIIPTDIQGMYRSGIPTISTASISVWYHTRKDTPDKVDTSFLGRSVRSFDRTLNHLLATPADKFKERDKTLWDADLEVVSRGDSDPQALVKVALRDNKNKPLPRTNVTATLFCDDFFARPDVVVPTDDQGNAIIPFTDLGSCKGRRWVHVSAGPEYPLVEKVKGLPSKS